MRLLIFITDWKQIEPTPAQFLREIYDQINQNTVTETLKNLSGPQTSTSREQAEKAMRALKRAYSSVPSSFEGEIDKETLSKGRRSR